MTERTLRGVVHEILERSDRLDLWPQCRIEILSLENQGLDVPYLRAHDNGSKCDNVVNSLVANVLGICPPPDGPMRVIGQPELADIDSDFDRDRREEIIQFMSDWFGHEHVAHVGAYQTYKPKSAIRTVLKFNGVEEDKIREFTKFIPAPKDGQKPDEMLEIALAASPDLDLRFQRYPEERELVETILGAFSAVTQHAAGVVIGSKAIHQVVPLLRCNKGIVTAVDMDDVAAMGLVKFDILGLGNVTMVAKCLELIKQRHGIEIDLVDIPLDDPRCIDRFNAGDTDTIFQFETRSFIEILRDVDVKSFDDLIDIVAINRPGGMKYISPKFYDRYRSKDATEQGPADSVVSPIGTYQENRLDPSRIRDIHPVVNEVLRETYGIPIFQEQAMRIAQPLANWTLIEADKLRKAIGKKKGDLFEACRKKFYKDAAKNGVHQHIIDEVWDMFKQFGGYAFNKAHAAVYALLGYWNMWLREHYTEEWYAAVLTTEFADTAGKKRMRDLHLERRMFEGKYDTKLKWYSARARSDGRRCVVHPPHVNVSDLNEAIIVGDHDVFLPLGSIPNIGSNVVELIRQRGLKTFENFHDLVLRSGTPQAAIAKLIENDACNCFGESKSYMMALLPDFVREREERRRAIVARQRKTEAQVDTSVTDVILGGVQFQPGINMLKKSAKATRRVARPKDRGEDGDGGVTIPDWRS